MDRAKMREDLVAYMDGELAAADARVVEAWLAGDAEAQQLRRQLQEDSLVLRGLLSAVLRDAPPQHLVAAVAPGPLRPEAPAETKAAALPVRPARAGVAPGWLAAAAVLCLIVGGTGGFFAGQHQARQEMADAAAEPQSRNWVVHVAQYHRLYAAEKRHLVEVAAAETPHIQSWLGNRLSMPLVVPDLTSFGLTFEGARLLAYEGEPLAQLIYMPADGRAVALCVIRSNTADKPPTAGREGDLNLVDWHAKGYGFIVIGWESEATMLAIAEASKKSFGS
jgi:anti-sigma factor RsiW